jgi:uncharacterized membrane protein YoaK (UPF0700 family)
VRRLPASAFRDLLLVVLTASSGAVDAISFLALGKLFTAFMTGNVVFLGIRAAGAPGADAVRITGALLAFASGVLVATRIVRPLTGPTIWPRRVTVALTVAAAVEVLFAAVWAGAGGRPSSGTAGLLICLSALAMGLQSGAVMSLGVRGVFTTAATATAILFATGWHETAAERRRLAGVLAGLLAGATAGGLLALHARAYAPLLPLSLTVLVTTLATTFPRALRVT